MPSHKRSAVLYSRFIGPRPGQEVFRSMSRVCTHANTDQPRVWPRPIMSLEIFNASAAYQIITKWENIRDFRKKKRDSSSWMPTTHKCRVKFLSVCVFHCNIIFLTFPRCVIKTRINRQSRRSTSASTCCKRICIFAATVKSSFWHAV